MKRYKIPWECVQAYYYHILHPDALDTKLLEQIKSPIEYISHAHGVRGPHKDPAWYYKDTVLPEEVPAKTSDAHGYLQILAAPNTSATELKAFIDKEYDRNLKQLATHPVLGAEEYQPAKLFKPGARVSRSDSAAIRHEIIRLHNKGLKSPQIREEIGAKFDRLYDESNIRKIIAAYKKSHKP
ncbi:MAG TPA: hypothetical protein VLF40_04940 [Candidatus Saccharimonadales bacterium]|nr:hypothetical protein [Candidatus Saccharimonadales bacterium]